MPSQFETDLLAIAPNTAKGTISILESFYGTAIGFCAGLDTFARIVDQNALQAHTPAFGEPWKSIYADLLNEMQTNNKPFRDAYRDALSMKGRPAFALLDAITNRIDAINQKAKTTGKQDMSDDQAQLAFLGYDLKLNLCGMHIEVNDHTMTDYDDSEIRMRMEDTGYKSRQRITDAIMITAKQNEYHPIKDYLDSLQWDGVSRIMKLAQYFKAHDPVLFPIMLQKWLIGAIARVMDGDQNPMLVIEGAQGSGKSTFAKWLCPDLKYYKESSIDPDNKDHRIATSEIWIWEVGELGSTTKKADREALKSFLTTDTFTERAAYGRYNQPYKAMASFIGTVNDESGFLNDPTGSRRFWVMGIDSIDFAYSKDININDIWAEAYHAYKHGESHDLDQNQKQKAEEIAEEYRMVNSVEEAIKKWFDITNVDTDFLDFNTIRSVLVDKDKANLSPRDASDVKISAALKAIGLKRTTKWMAQTAIGHNKRIKARGYLGIKVL